MCVLCGEMIMNVHWTDQPLHDDEYRNKRRIVAGELARDRRRLRIRRVSLANKIMEYYGLKLADWQGSRYILTARSGQTKIVGDLGGMWKAGEDLLHRSIDPLDTALLDFLEAGHG